jgi:hypothetical protein
MRYEIELLENIISEIIPRKTYNILNEIDSIKLNSLIVQLLRYEVFKSLETTIDVQGYKLKKLIPFNGFIVKIHGHSYSVYRINDYTLKITKD